jgi:predicted SAM-dependent methyltransferase
LQIGGGDNILEGWLNTDFMPRNNETVILDVTKPLFFKSNTFDYIFCEHMIEHITYNEAIKMLRECLRILRSGGKLRISTPDLEVYIALFSQQKSEMQERHIEWISNNWLKRQGVNSRNEAFVLNLMMRGWGHKFLYDFTTLKLVLSDSGFSEIKSVQVKISEDENLNGIESHGDVIKKIKGIQEQFGSKFDNEMNEFGSLTVEAVKR